MGSNARSNAAATRNQQQQGMMVYKSSIRRQADEVPPPRKKLTLDLASYLPPNFGRRGIPEVIQVPANPTDASAPSQTASHGESMPSQVQDAVKKEEGHTIKEPNPEEMPRQQEEHQMIDAVETAPDATKEESHPIKESKPQEMSKQQQEQQMVDPVETANDSPKEESNPIDQMPQAPYSNPSATYPPSYAAHYAMAPQQQQYGANAPVGMPVYRAQSQPAVYAIPHGGGYFTQQVDQIPQVPYSNPSASYPPSYAAYYAMAPQQQGGVNAPAGMPIYRAQPQQTVYATPRGGGYFTQQLDQMQGFAPSSLGYANAQRGGPRNAPPGLSHPPPGINPTTMVQGTQQPQYQYAPGSGGYQ